jgi:hypothetical protein
MLGFSASPDHFIDITDFIDKKVAAVGAHESHQASSQNFEYAEGFKLFSFHRDEEE